MKLDFGQGPESNPPYTKLPASIQQIPFAGCRLWSGTRSLAAGEFLTDISLVVSTRGTLEVFAHSFSHPTNIQEQESDQTASTESHRGCH